MSVAPISSLAAAAVPPPPPKPSLAQIERTYQVADDRKEDWSPKLFGAIGVGEIGGKQNLTVQEGRLLDNLTRDRGILGLSEFRGIRDQAFADANRREPPPAASVMPPSVAAQIAQMPRRAAAEARALWPTNDGHNDAFRHTYWNARLTAEFGEPWARQFATAHEAAPGNPGMREAMDLYNNEVGRRIATDNPGASPAELADKVQEALRNGDLVVVDQGGRLAWSDTVAVGHHGMAPTPPAPPHIAVPNGDASAR